MKKTLAAAAVAAVFGPVVALAQDRMPQADHLLHFEGLTDEQVQRVEQAHSQLAAAHADMCNVMVDIYIEHAQRVHQDEVPTEASEYLKRMCAAKSFANHVEMSVDIHDRIHREAHVGD